MYDYTDFYIFLGGTLVWGLTVWVYAVIKDHLKGKGK